VNLGCGGGGGGDENSRQRHNATPRPRLQALHGVAGQRRRLLGWGGVPWEAPPPFLVPARAGSPGVSFRGLTPYATSFPQVVTTAASFNTTMFNAIGATIATETRVFANQGNAGNTFWTPNINGEGAARAPAPACGRYHGVAIAASRQRTRMRVPALRSGAGSSLGPQPRDQRRGPVPGGRVRASLCDRHAAGRGPALHQGEPRVVRTSWCKWYAAPRVGSVPGTSRPNRVPSIPPAAARCRPPPAASTTRRTGEQPRVRRCADVLAAPPPPDATLRAAWSSGTAPTVTTSTRSSRPRTRPTPTCPRSRWGAGGLGWHAALPSHTRTLALFPLCLQSCVTQGHVSGIMCCECTHCTIPPPPARPSIPHVVRPAHPRPAAYNEVNGIPSCADSFLQQTVLREEWGFDGCECGSLPHRKGGGRGTGHPLFTWVCAQT
jgi:hypothetical protein